MALVENKEIIDRVQACGLPFPNSLQTQINGIRIRAEKAVRDYVGYDVEQSERVEYHPQKLLTTRYDGDETAMGFDLIGGKVVARDTFPQQRRALVLLCLPVRSIASVYDDPASHNTNPPTWSALLPDNSYYLDEPGSELCWSGILYRYVGSWGVQPNSIKVTYTAGLTADELLNDYPEFREAVFLTCTKMIADMVARSRMALVGGVPASVSIEDFSASFTRSEGMLGSFGGTGVGSSILPTEAAQQLAHRVHPAKMF